MPIYKGSQNITPLYLGGGEIKEAYVGDVMVYGKEVLPENCNYKISGCRMKSDSEQFYPVSCENDDLYSFAFDKGFSNYYTIHIKSEQSENFGFIYAINYYSSIKDKSTIQGAIDKSAIGPIWTYSDYDTYSGITVDRTFNCSNIHTTGGRQIFITAKKGTTPVVELTEMPTLNYLGYEYGYITTYSDGIQLHSGPSTGDRFFVYKYDSAMTVHIKTEQSDESNVLYATAPDNPTASTQEPCVLRATGKSCDTDVKLSTSYNNKYLYVVGETTPEVTIV